MRVIVLLFIVLPLISCETEDVPSPAGNVPETLQSHLDHFVLEAERRGVVLDLSKLSFEFKAGLTTNQGLAIGVCNRTSDLHLVKIDTTNALWGFARILGQEEIVFHELGHCLLERDHNDTKFQTGDFISIMRTKGAFSYSSFKISRGFLGSRPDNMVHRRDYYLDELFDENTAPPCWSDPRIIPPYPTRLFDEEFLNQGAPSQLIVDAQGTIGLLSKGRWYRFQGGQFTEEAFGLTVMALANDQDGNTWMAVRQSESEYIGTFDSGVFQPVLSDEHIPVPLTDLEHLFIDQKGRVWIGTNSGAVFFQQVVGQALMEVAGLPEGRIFKLLIGSDHQVIMAKNQSLLIFENPGDFVELTASNASMPPGFIRDLAIDGQGTVWMMVDNGQRYLVQYHQSTGTMQLDLNHINMSGVRINALAADHSGTLWVATSNGIRRWENQYFSNYCTYNTGSPLLNFTNMAIDGNGDIWSLGFDFDDLRTKILLSQIGS